MNLSCRHPDVGHQPDRERKSKGSGAELNALSFNGLLQKLNWIYDIKNLIKSIQRGISLVSVLRQDHPFDN